MAHLLDAEVLIDRFAETDPDMPLLVFALLSIYLRDGPFEFNATALAERLSQLPMTGHYNPEKLAAVQPQLERFFESGPDGWRPRAGVLHHVSGPSGSGQHAGDLPGQAM
jgi:hypothetical protein